MKNQHLTPILLAIAALVGACSSAPTSTRLLDQTRTDYWVAQNNPGVASYASLELKQAGESLEQANAAAVHNESAEKIDKLAYLAKQKIALTQEVAKQKMAEADVANAGKQRDQLRLDQRTNEANQAKRKAELALLSAQAAQVESIDANRKAQLARDETMDAKRKTQQAQDEAGEAQRKTQEAQAKAVQLEAQLAELAAKKTERGIVITLGDVLFGTDLARLNSEGMRTAQKLASILQLNPLRTLLVEGFTDSTGTASHNQELSERRANAVKSALLDQGIAVQRLSIRGYGESYPVAANDTAANRQLNRRVEIVLSDDSGRTTSR